MKGLIPLAMAAFLLAATPLRAEDDEAIEMIDEEGKRSTKADELDFVRTEEWDPGSFEYRIERLSIYDGKVAIIAGTGIATRYTYKSSNVLIKEDGRWQAIASHVSGVEERATE